MSKSLSRHIQLPTASTATTVSFALVALASTGVLYYYHTWLSSLDHDRRRHVHYRRRLTRTEDRYASLNVRGRFLNPFDEWREPGWVEVVWAWLRRRTFWQSPPNVEDSSFSELLVPKKPDVELAAASGVLNSLLDDEMLSESWISPSVTASMIISTEGAHHSVGSQSSDAMTFTWLGQSTCFVTVDGLNILTDPVLGNCATPAGMAHLHSSPCLFTFLPPPDIVLVSHNHPDHLDLASVHHIGDSATWYIPLGLRDWFVRRGVINVVELDWWQEIHHPGRRDIVISSIPAMHFSGTNPLNHNTTLWSSFLVKAPSANFFHCGSTHPLPVIHANLPTITLAAIPLVGCDLTPEDVVKLHGLLKPRVSVGVHWGKSRGYGEVIQRVSEACVRKGFEFGIGGGEGVRVVGVGQSIVVRA